MNLLHRSHQTRLSQYSWLKIALLICVLLGWTDPARAQEPAAAFEHISLEQGLSHGVIFSIVQDQAGFLWFGAQSGLNKYDGYQITVFKHNPLDPNSLSNDNAGNLYIDRAGIIWIGTWGGGLNRLDPRTEQFTIYRNDPNNPNSLGFDRVQTIFEDSSGALWVGTGGGGLDKLDRQTGFFTHYRHDPANPNSLSHDRIWRIVEDKAGLLWIATSDGLNRFDPQTEMFTRYHNELGNPNSLSHSLIRTLYVDRSGVLWVGTEEGLNQYHPESDSFTRYLADPANPARLSDNTINAILEDSAGNLWIGTSRGGLNKFNRQIKIFSRYINHPLNPKSLSYNDIRWIHEDSSGMLWIATRGGGVNKFNPNLENFSYLKHDPANPNSLNNNDVRAIYVDRAKNLWIGTKGGGLNKFDPVNGRFTSYQQDPNNPNSLSSNDVYAIYEDRAGRFWLGMSGGGLMKFEPQTETFTHYPANPDDPNSLSSGDINTIYEDQSELLWVGTKGGGLNKFDPETGRFTRYQYNAEDPASLGNNDVYAIVAAPANTLWLGTYGGGLNQLALDAGQLATSASDTVSGGNGHFLRYQYDPDNPDSLSNNDIYTIQPNPAGSLWIGTANGGLNQFDPETNKFIRFTEENGLSSNTVYGVLADSQGHLWLSTSKGLTKFNPSANTFTDYDASTGLESIGYNEGAYHKSWDGRMFFGGINGLISFDPDQIKENNHAPPIVLTAINLPNKKFSLTQALAQMTAIELFYEDDVLSFEFAALDYTNPAKNQYAYQLEGFDADWVQAGTRRFASYTNLDPGTYTFRVKGTNNAGVGNEAGVSMRVIVHPPFWETWWFRAGIILGGLGLLLVAYKSRVSRIESQRRMLQTLVAERTSELVTANQHLQTLTDQLQTELSLARDIQRSLLPPPRPPCVRPDVICYSASAHVVGGDFYAYYLSNTSHQERVALAVGDASGKGMPAALIMAVSMASFQSLISQSLPPASLLARLDQVILPYTRARRQNCALCYVEITTSHASRSSVLRAANAGCIAPIIRRSDGSLEWIDIGGPPLGIGLGAQDSYAEVEVSLQPGDLVILTSDGLVEATNAAGEMFGFERLNQAIAKGPAGNAEEMLNHLKAEAAAFIQEAEPHDDLTLVVIHQGELNP
jgi:ligand-binding sensor domain-containing protein/serine phosphatase RsbU (regulator of sigma subunit)